MTSHPDIDTTGPDQETIAIDLREAAALQRAAAVLDAIGDKASYPIAVMEVASASQNTLIYANAETYKMLHSKQHAAKIDFEQNTQAMIGRQLWECVQQGQPQQLEEHLLVAGHDVWTQSIYTPILREPPLLPWVVISSFDISERKRREIEEIRNREIVIENQSHALAELSTPLLAISEHVVVLPLIGTVDSRRAQQIMDTLLSGISETSAQVAILDITGVSVVDTQVANAIIRAAQATRLLGAQIIITGIRPEVAQTLIGLGIDLGGITTCGTLQAGIAQSLQRSDLVLR
ncbi:STAS domain-containing protein [Chloroflexia bacterium SDU3-3]|nr:STAS domain-containing protein [Chloroflexia bacterium SDU3-3]